MSKAPIRPRQADGAVKTAIFSGNSARLYNFAPAQHAALDDNRSAAMKSGYELAGPTPSYVNAPDQVCGASSSRTTTPSSSGRGAR